MEQSLQWSEEIFLFEKIVVFCFWGYFATTTQHNRENIINGTIFQCLADWVV